MTIFLWNRPYSSVARWPWRTIRHIALDQTAVQFRVLYGPIPTRMISALSEGKTGRFLEYVAVEFAVRHCRRNRMGRCDQNVSSFGAFGLYGLHTDTGRCLVLVYGGDF